MSPSTLPTKIHGEAFCKITWHTLPSPSHFPSRHNVFSNCSPQKTFKSFGFQIFVLSVPDKGYLRYASCARNLISTFLLFVPPNSKYFSNVIQKSVVVTCFHLFLIFVGLFLLLSLRIMNLDGIVCSQYKKLSCYYGVFINVMWWTLTF
jgi:hypothetical protein